MSGSLHLVFFSEFLLLYHMDAICTATVYLKVALGQKILEKFYVSNINIPNSYPEQKI